MFRKMPIILLTMIVLIGVTHTWIPLPVKSFLLGVSLSLKSIIIFALPFLIFGLLFKTATQLAKKASIMILFLLIAICISNFFSVMMGYGVGSFAYHLDSSMAFPEKIKPLIAPWEFSLPNLVANDKAMFSGLILGLILGWWKPKLATVISSKIEKVVNAFLKGLLYVIPFFIAGFVVKICHEGQMTMVLKNYSLVFLLIAISVYSYIALIYGVVTRFRKADFIRSLKNMLPAAITGFGSMSSAAAMPLTILGTEKNSKDPELAKSVIPVTVNIHLIGDCFIIPVLAFAILKSFGMPEPSFLTYLVFAAYFVMAKFSVAGVPGGTVLVMLPILEGFLGFNGEMLSLITALYILFDPVGTCSNIFGNGGFAVAFSKLFGKKKVSQKVGG